MEHRGWKWMVREQDGGMEKDGAKRMVFDGAGVGWRDGKRRSGKAENGMANGRRRGGAADGVCTSVGWSAKKPRGRERDAPGRAVFRPGSTGLAYYK